jgi:Protein of unknown function (DUF2970)
MRNTLSRFAAAVLAVLSAFVGIRKRGAAVQDQSLRPIHFIAAAVVCVAVLIALIITLVKTVTR